MRLDSTYQGLTPETRSHDREPPPRARRSRWKRLLACWRLLALLLVVLHPLLLGIALREGLRHLIGMAWWKITIGEVQVAAGRPVCLPTCIFMPMTRSVPARMSACSVSRWIFPISGVSGKEARLIELAEIEGIRGSFDLRPTALPPPPHIPDLTAEEQRLQAETIMKVPSARGAAAPGGPDFSVSTNPTG